MFLRYGCIMALVFALAGCASVPMSDQKEDISSKNFVTKSDVSGIYVFRNESFGAAIHMDVMVDGKPLGKTAAKTFFLRWVAPGHHTVTSISENSDSISFDTEPGKLYYVWQEVKMGVLYARTKLHFVTEAEGQKGVLESKLAQTESGL